MTRPHTTHRGVYGVEHSGKRSECQLCRDAAERNYRRSTGW